jgi:hypothetical protein
MKSLFGSAAQEIDAPAQRGFYKSAGQWSRLGSVAFVIAFNVVVWTVVALVIFTIL